MDFYLKSKARTAFSAFGMFVCYFYYGILQERITRGTFGDERFQNILSLVFILCIVNFVFAKFVHQVVLAEDDDVTPSKYYAAASLSYIIASLTAQKALTWVSYPAQVLGKSCKPIPVMLFGVIFCRIRYPALKYFFVMIIVVGVSLFMYKNDESSVQPGQELRSSLGTGELLLFTSLVFDGVTGVVQERLNADHAPSPVSMMAEINKWSIFYLAIVISTTEELWQLSAFVHRHPDIIWQLLLLSLIGAVGQFFVYICLSDVGPLQCSLITTTRKLVTILASVILFGNPVTDLQWIGAGFVFSGLFLDLYFGKKRLPDVQDNESDQKQVSILCC